MGSPKDWDKLAYSKTYEDPHWSRYAKLGPQEWGVKAIPKQIVCVCLRESNERSEWVANKKLLLGESTELEACYSSLITCNQFFPINQLTN